jgi:hypothetical protein
VFPIFGLDKPEEEPTSGLEPLTCSLLVGCYRVRVVPLGPEKPINEPILSHQDQRRVRLVPPDVARVGISVGIKFLAPGY